MKKFHPFLSAAFWILIVAISLPTSLKAQLLTVNMSPTDPHDTIYTCDYYWGIQCWPDSRIKENPTWIIEYRDGQNWIQTDTVLGDTIGITDYFKEGSIRHYGSDGVYFYEHRVEVRRLALNTSYSAGTCNSALQLHASTNYSGNGAPTYSWEPAEYLSDPGSANPGAFISGNMNFSVTVTVPSGCAATRILEVLMDVPQKPSICMVSVDSTTNKNIIYWQTPSESGLDSILIFRETDVTGEYKMIGELSVINPGFFIDNESNPMVQSNKYKIASLDSCGNYSEKSDPHKTIHLTINQGVNNSWNLIWEPYEGFTVSTYRIYRSTSVGAMELVGTTSGSSNQFTDFTAPEGYVNYQIEVINPSPCDIAGLKSTQSILNRSRSNIASNQPTDLQLTKLYNDWSIYPNPFGTILHIELTRSNPDGIIELSGLDGKIIKRMEFNTNRIDFDASDIKPGAYILKIHSGNETYSNIVFRK